MNSMVHGLPQAVYSYSVGQEVPFCYETQTLSSSSQLPYSKSAESSARIQNQFL